MLALDRLAIVDFGPYRGRQEIVFSRANGVYLIYGPNGRGKTNLHNAFRYALYGYVLDRRRVGKLEDVANTEAKKAQGYGSFETILDFHNDGARFRLTRRYDESQQPRELLILEQDGVPFSQDESRESSPRSLPRP